MASQFTLTPFSRTSGGPAFPDTWPILNLQRRGPGNYILSSLKSVSSSEEFDEMSESVRKCQFEQNWAECRRSLFREQVFYWQCSITELWNKECVQEYDQTH